jgi:hypothetical protein
MTAEPILAAFLWLQEVPPRALLMGMTLAYLLCFAGLLFAYLSYRRRGRSAKKKGEEKRP